MKRGNGSGDDSLKSRYETMLFGNRSEKRKGRLEPGEQTQCWMKLT